MTDGSEQGQHRRGRATRDPWSVPVQIGQIPVTGLHKVIAPTAAEATALAETAGLRDVTNIRAVFDLMPVRGDQIRVEGRVTGVVGQTCVVTLEPLENAVDETIAVVFAPAEQVQELAALHDTADDDDDHARPDPPEPIENGVIDLGRVASDALFLGLDPYPRKPDAVFEPPAAESDPEDHPFAALKALKPGS